MSLTTVRAPNFFVTPRTSMAKAVVMKNIQQPTSNIEHPMPTRSQAHRMLGVRCWMLVVSF
jgi:hypothetical protein